MGGKRETRGSTLKIISSDFPHKNRCGFFTHAARHLFFDTLAVLFQARAQQPLLLERLGPWMRLLSRIAHLALPLVVLVPYASSSVQASFGATAGKNKILCTVDNNGKSCHYLVSSKDSSSSMVLCGVYGCAAVPGAAPTKAVKRGIFYMRKFTAVWHPPAGTKLLVLFY